MKIDEIGKLHCVDFFLFFSSKTDFSPTVSNLFNPVMLEVVISSCVCTNIECGEIQTPSTERGCVRVCSVFVSFLRLSDIPLRSIINFFRFFSKIEIHVK